MTAPLLARPLMPVPDVETVAAERLAMVRKWSHRRARSQQVEIGWSQAGQDCTAALWHAVHGTPTTNHDTHVLASMRGTAIHSVIDDMHRAEDPNGDRYLIEHEVSYRDILGHVDLFDRLHGVVEDAKTKTSDEVRALRQHGPSRQYRWQLHGYGAGLEEQGYTVHTVRLTYYGIDGADDIAVWQEPYARAIADEAFAHIEAMRARETPPGPQKDAKVWCSRFCPVYDPTGVVGCTGLQPKAKGDEITDPTLVAAVAEYKTAHEEGKAAWDRKDAARAALDGVAGWTADGLTVAYQGGTEKVTEVPDDEFIRDYYRLETGLDVPTRTVTSTSARYFVVRPTPVPKTRKGGL